jgi:hypothetical protein
MRRGLRACVALNDLSGARRLYLALGKALREDLDTTPLKENSSLLPTSDTPCYPVGTDTSPGALTTIL